MIFKKVLSSAAMLFIVALTSSACFENEQVNPTSANIAVPGGTTQIPYCGTPITVNLMAGQHIDAGDIIVGNDQNNLYVTYTTAGDWRIKATQLYVGACNAIPRNNAGNPQVGLFPYKATHNPFTNTYTYTIPLQNLPDCGCVAAHAEAIRVNASGEVVQSETGWGQGTPMTPTGGSWAMSFEYCKKACTPPPPPPGGSEGCSFSQGRWLSKPNLVWGKTVTIGGHTYTQAEGRAIWDTKNQGGLADSKAGFTQVGAIRLSGNTVLPTASVWKDVAIVEQYLSTLGKLNPSYLPTGNKAAKEAAGRIGKWIDNNHCKD